jgi:hypothetical protein
MTTREYAGGRLQREDVLRVADTDLRRRAAKRDARRRLSDDHRDAGQVPRAPRVQLPSGPGRRLTGARRRPSQP